MNGYNVPCPQCGARPGMPCTNAWGLPISTYHGSRNL